MARRPAPTRIADRAVTTQSIDVGAVTTIELAEGAVTYEILDPGIETDIDNAATDATNALATANGKNKVYRQTTQPTGGTYADGDLWFDTDDDNKIYRYSSSTLTWVGFTLGDNALASLSANKITAGTIDASVITVSNIDAGNITVGTLTGIEVIATTGSIGQWVIQSNGIESPNGNIYLYADNGGAASVVVGTGASNQVVLSDSGALYSVYGANEATINYPDGVTAWTVRLENTGTSTLTKMSYYGIIAEEPGITSSWLFEDSIGTQGTLFTDVIRTWGDLGIRVTQGWGFAYDDVSAGPGLPNFMALRWDNPDIIGIVDNNAWAVLGTASDARGKMNVANAEAEYLDATYNKFRVVSYNPVDMLDEENLHLYPKRLGVIAQEVKEFAPTLVTQKPYDSEAMMTVHYAGIVPYLIQAVQDLNDRLKIVEGA